MDRARRNGYLQAIGIVPWRLRSTPAEAARQPDAAAAVDEARDAAAADARGAPDPAGLEPITLAEDWDGLREQVLACRRCRLCETRTQAVFGVGARDADLMVIGEGPGADEDRTGEPFVGRAGRLLDEMLAAIGRSRKQNVYIANVVKCRPPGNRDPAPEESAACRPYLERQIDLLGPKLILAVGRIAAQQLLRSSEPLARLRGRVHEMPGSGIPVLVTYHPAYLLRSPREKAKAWTDLKQVRRLLAPT